MLGSRQSQISGIHWADSLVTWQDLEQWEMLLTKWWLVLFSNIHTRAHTCAHVCTFTCSHGHFYIYIYLCTCTHSHNPSISVSLSSMMKFCAAESRPAWNMTHPIVQCFHSLCTIHLSVTQSWLPGWLLKYYNVYVHVTLYPKSNRNDYIISFTLYQHVSITSSHDKKGGFSTASYF